MNDVVIQLDDLSKTYRTGIRRKKVEALSGLSFTVNKGEIFGFLGPNGAGKTTTIRIMMGLISAGGGEAHIFGHKIPNRAARQRLGFLPEAPYFYEYLTVRELLDLTGRLFGMTAKDRADRSKQLIERVGLGDAANKQLRGYSKGMLQRAGIAQALVNDPELVVLDEPMSGLDPIGRKEVRDIIYSVRDAGNTVFFSSHILADVEMIADRIAILVDGKLRSIGTLNELVRETVVRTDVALQIPHSANQDLVDALSASAAGARRRGSELLLNLPPDAEIDEFLVRAREAGTKVISIIPHQETLEDVFIRGAQRSERVKPVKTPVRDELGEEE